ncbi:hypothetical protein NLI96_g7912 [Meripilus lineatus]|uniref:Uncharacterized protein n=1 Tax=Meripilus lineatus TaxID=2056292 RepID=A0AAD5V2Z5_9APHY|nr:hypothetical protein NLI96_g7912 [Physisporinus lineatus]
MSLSPSYRDASRPTQPRQHSTPSSLSSHLIPTIPTPPSDRNRTSIDSGIGNMSPPYQGWTPGLAPIDGSPSYPPATAVTVSELEDEELEEQDLADQRYRGEHDDYGRERDYPYGEAAAHPGVMLQGDLEQGFGSVSQDDPSVAGSRSGWRTRGFVGGFIRGLRRIPEAMVKNSPRGQFVVPLSPSDGGLGEPPVLITNGSQLGDPDSPPSMISYPASPSTAPPNPSSNGATISDTSSQSARSDATPRIPRRFRRHSVAYPHLDSVISSPQQVSIGELSGYEETQTPFPFTNPDDKSWRSYADRIHRVFVDVMAMPWVAPQVAEEYIPDLDSDRGRRRKTEYPVSWYAPRGSKVPFPESEEPKIEIISSPPPPLPVHSDEVSSEYVFTTVPPTPTVSGGSYSYYRPRSMASPSSRRTMTLSPSMTDRSSVSMSEGGFTAIRPSRSPATVTTSIGGWPSPGASSHGLGRHSITSSYHYYASPRQQSRHFAGGGSVTSTPRTRYESEGFLSPSVR